MTLRARILLTEYAREIFALLGAERVALRRGDAAWLATFRASRARYERAAARVERILRRAEAPVTIPAAAWNDEPGTEPGMEAAQ